MLPPIQSLAVKYLHAFEKRQSLEPQVLARTRHCNMILPRCTPGETNPFPSATKMLQHKEAAVMTDMAWACTTALCAKEQGGIQPSVAGMQVQQPQEISQMLKSTSLKLSSAGKRQQLRKIHSFTNPELKTNKRYMATEAHLSFSKHTLAAFALSANAPTLCHTQPKGRCCMEPVTKLRINCQAQQH